MSMSDIAADSFHSGSQTVEITSGGKKHLLTVKELGYAHLTGLIARAKTESLQVLPLVISEAVENSKGERFTYDESLRLKKEIFEPLMMAVIDLNGLGLNKKKSQESKKSGVTSP